MPEIPLSAPQMVLNSRMLYSSWMPADPDAVRALLPEGGPTPAGPVYMNQYVVDSPDQTSGFGAYSLTYLGIDIAGMMDPVGMTPARYMLFYFNSSEHMSGFVRREYDLPAVPGATDLTLDGGRVVATTTLDGRPVIRTTARVGDGAPVTASGSLTYVRQKEGRFMAGNFPWVAKLADGFAIEGVEFLDPDHPVYALRPADPLEVVAASSFYSPDDSFVYPGGVYEVGF
jgi:ketosteroid isomerase-like protein